MEGKMSNRRFEMYQIRQIIHQFREGGTVRGLARLKLADRKKLRHIRTIADKQGWLAKDSPMPSDEMLAEFFKIKRPSTQSLLETHKEKVQEWHQQGVQGTTIYYHLKREHGFSGSYNIIQRFLKELKSSVGIVTTMALPELPWYARI